MSLENASRLVVMRGNKASRSPRKDVTERSLRQPDPKAQEEVQFLVKLLEDAKEERTENVERITELEGSLEVKQQAMQEYLRLTELKSQQQQERVRQRNEMLKSWVEMGTALCYIKKDLPIKDMIEKSCEMNPDAQRSSQEIYRKLSASESSGLPQIGGTSFEALERAMTVQKKDLWDTTPGALLSPMKQSPGKLAGSSSSSSTSEHSPPGSAASASFEARERPFSPTWGDNSVSGKVKRGLAKQVAARGAGIKTYRLG